MRRLLAFAMALLAGCGGPQRPPPPPLWFEGLPVSGSLADAKKAGFGRCAEDRASMRCRRDAVMFLGQGPYDAALDLVGSDGAGGFDQLTLWHGRDQGAVLAITAVLERQGWRSCFTGEDGKGDQAIYSLEGSPVKISMDISYWAKRRLRVIPAGDRREKACSPEP
ncbi:MAG TPA: hypothetical protein VGB04_04415 [Allosphingosinicella sp.]|jgi:hypothetical protein